MKAVEIEHQLFTLPLAEPPSDFQRNEETVRRNYPVLRAWMKSLTPSQRWEYKNQKQRAFNHFGVSSRHALVQKISNPSEQPTLMKQSNSLAGGLVRYEGSDLNDAINRCAGIADSIIESHGSRFPKDTAGSVEMVNEVERARYPYQLIGMIFNPDYAIKAKFEAWRKLQLTHKAYLNEQSSQKNHVDDQLDYFTEFLNQADVWLPETKIGQFRSVYFLGHHDRKNKFECTDVETLILSKAEAEDRIRRLPNGQTLTQVSRRQFKIETGPRKGQTVNIYITNDRKDVVQEISKNIRKGQRNPDLVEDRIRTRFVADNVEDLRAFIDHLSFCAEKMGSDFMMEEISDTLTQGKYNGGNHGSSPEWQALKFFLTVGGTKIEVEGFTNKAYLNSEYKKGVSHSEYAVKRLFEPEGESAIEWFFPPELYEYTPSIVKERILRQIRRDVEEPVPYPFHLLAKASRTLGTAAGQALHLGRATIGKVLTVVK